MAGNRWLLGTVDAPTTGVEIRTIGPDAGHLGPCVKLPYWDAVVLLLSRWKLKRTCELWPPVYIAAFSKTPEGWRTPRPGGHPLVPLFGNCLGL